MTDEPKAPGKPRAVKTLNGRPLPGKPVLATPDTRMPRAISNVNGKDRPGALPMPADRSVSALARPNILEKWSADAAGIRAVESGDNVITMFGAIGEDYWSGGGITAKTVTAQLRAIGDRPVEVQINSPGGDMFEGIAIYNVLREHAQPVTIKIMGMAASAASVIAMAGDTVEIGAASFLMIHNCWVVAVGNRHDMAETATYLGPFDQAMADVYAQRSGRTAVECAKWMDDETYMSGSIAIERGFADTLLTADQTTRDEQAKASDRERTAITALELKLVAGGDTRTQARDHITKIKGTPGAAPVADTPGAGGETELTGLLAGLLSTIKS
jgi:ATP-dependent Clp protease protease subunit